MIIGFTPGVGFFPSPNRIVSSHLTTETESIVVKVYPLFMKQVVIEWAIPPSWGNCSFNIYKSQYELSDFHKVNTTPITNTNIYSDSTTRDSSKFRDHQYIVECRLPTGQYIKSPEVTWENTRSNWVQIRAKEIARRENMLLNRYVGVDSMIFRRKVFGKRCPSCWNATIEKVTTDSCSICLGTSFEGGYFTGYRTKLQYEPTSNPSEYGPQGVVESNTVPAWTTSVPNIHTFDLVLRIPDMKMYRVASVQTTELQAIVVRQLVQLTELSKGDIETELCRQAMPMIETSPGNWVKV